MVCLVATGAIKVKRFCETLETVPLKRDWVLLEEASGWVIRMWIAIELRFRQVSEGLQEMYIRLRRTDRDLPRRCPPGTSKKYCWTFEGHEGAGWLMGKRLASNSCRCFARKSKTCLGRSGAMTQRVETVRHLVPPSRSDPQTSCGSNWQDLPLCCCCGDTLAAPRHSRWRRMPMPPSTPRHCSMLASFLACPAFLVLRCCERVPKKSW